VKKKLYDESDIQINSVYFDFIFALIGFLVFRIISPLIFSIF